MSVLETRSGLSVVTNDLAAVTSVDDPPLNILFLQTEEVGNIAKLATPEEGPIGPYEDWIRVMLDIRRKDMKTYHLADEDAPPTSREIAQAGGIVIGGSGHLVGDGSEVVAKTRQAVRMAAEAGIPVTAICFGQQATLVEFGGTVSTLDQFDFGVSKITLTDEGMRDPAYQDLVHEKGREFLVFKSNGQFVNGLPASTPGREVAVLANGAAPHESLRIGDPRTGIRTGQWHPDLRAHVMAALEPGKVAAGILPPDQGERMAGVRQNAEQAQKNGELYARGWKNHVVKPRLRALSAA